MVEGGGRKGKYGIYVKRNEDEKNSGRKGERGTRHG